MENNYPFNGTYEPEHNEPNQSVPNFVMKQDPAEIDPIGQQSRAAQVNQPNPMNQVNQANRTWNTAYQNTHSAYGENANKAYNTFDTSYYDNMAQSRQQQQAQNRQAAPGKPKRGIKKFIMAAVLGLIFGLFAAGAYVGVTYPASKLLTVTQTAADVPVSSPNVITGFDINIPDDAQGSAVAGARSNVGTVTAIVSDVSGVVEQVMPSVVSIYGEYLVNGYFGRSIESGSGSGIIIGENEDELLIVTNYHVVEDSKSLSVSFINGKEADASLKGNDTYNDLAVISVSLKDLDAETLAAISYAKLGDSDALKVGEPTIAIGNALGYGQSVTTGVVSAITDVMIEENQTRTMIQTDAAINPGNSGGALLNMNGEVIGINELKKGGTYVEGMGYAIPITFAKPIIAELSTKETKQKAPENQKGYLGIYGVDVTEAEAENFKLPVGVYVTQVHDGYAAAKAGLRRGDVITAVNGEAVKNFEALQQELSYHKAGDTVTLEVSQGGVVNELSVVLGRKVE